MACTVYWWRLGRIRVGLDPQAWTYDITSSVGYASCGISAREFCAGLDYLIAAYGESRSTGLEIFFKFYKETATSIFTVAYIMDLGHLLHLAQRGGAVRI